ncbi:hypothetical protein D6C99_06165 [Aureobasidium pullulans]|uniref:DUF2470 domain-containing protein n=1 Tax=Aureobasidium pullulans TaxID=5580 RepID=A0AB74J840_AURPU|nr:hypothetical protein D6D21_01622 [Aureobasidium pullulans]THY46268.1 hypothetical protein D6C99_06165 [Aureobasidium pullulans]
MSTPQEQTALVFISAFSTLDPQLFTSLCTSTCTHHFLPSSMHIHALSSAAFASHISSLSQVLRSFPVTASDVMFDEKRNKVSIHATSVTEFWEEGMDDGVSGEEWRYKGEYVFMFEFEKGEGEEAGKISKVVEFVDSLGTERLRGLIKRARENMANKETERISKGD